MDADIAFDFIEDCAVVTVMRGNFPPDVALSLVEILLEEDIDCFEFTTNSVQPLEAMLAVKTHYGDDVCAGMGTVLDTEWAQRALDAGADFIVSPVYQPDVVEHVQKAGSLIVPGVITPTEAVQAWAMKVRLLKLFPIGPLGVDYFKSVFGPLNHMKFMCSGAINAENAQQFLKSGAMACGVGGWLTGDGTWSSSRIRSRARILNNAVTMAFEGPPALRDV